MSQDEKKNVETESVDPNGSIENLKRSRGLAFFASKRFVLPVLYLGASALIIALVYERGAIWGGGTANPSGGVTTTGTSTTTEPTQTVTSAPMEKFIWPVEASQASQAVVTKGYFNNSADASAQASAVVEYDKTYYAHKGYDIALKSGKPFDVIAAVSGTVTQVENSQLMGVSISVRDADGYETEYQSLSKADVKVGDNVRQGEVLGVSGYSTYEPDAKNHLYFEVLKDNQPVDPGTLLPRK